MALVENLAQASTPLETATQELDARGQPFDWTLLDLGYRPAEDQFPKNYVPRTEAAERTYSLIQCIELGYIPRQWPEGFLPRSKEGREAMKKFHEHMLADKAASQKRWLIVLGVVAAFLLVKLISH